MWQGLFFLILLSNLYLGTNFVIKFFDYTCQYPVEEVKIDHFNVQPGPKGSFFLGAAFEYQEKQVEYQFKEKFINEFVAEEALEDFRKETWMLYKNSYDESLSLQRYFPMKELVHCLLAFSVSAYFLWLYSYSYRFRIQK